MRINYYFRATDQNSDIVIGFSDTDFLKESNKFGDQTTFSAVFTVQVNKSATFLFSVDII